MNEDIQNIINHLKDNVGINFLALDINETILDTHMGNHWNEYDILELCMHVQPVFAKLIVAALTNEMEVAIVTSTAQISLVRVVIDHIFNASRTKDNHLGLPHLGRATLKAIGVLDEEDEDYIDTSRRIPIRGLDGTWNYEVLDATWKDDGVERPYGKSPHISSAVRELKARREKDYLRAKEAGTSDGGTASGSGSNDPKTPSPNRPAKKARTSPEPIEPNTTLVVDNVNNVDNVYGRDIITHGLNKGIRAVWFNPKEPDMLLSDLSRLE
jgi:hypothetical protein